MDQLIGEIRLFAGEYAPLGWSFCDGSLHPIDNSSLWHLIGTTYGGDGQTTFAVPDLRGRVPVGAGQGRGLSAYTLGQGFGAESVTLTPDQAGAHSHVLQASGGMATTATPGPGVMLATTGATVRPFNDKTLATGSFGTFNAAAIGVSGSGQPHENRMASVGINYIIAHEGEWPSP